MQQCLEILIHLEDHRFDYWSAPPAGPADTLFSNYKAKQSGIDERYFSSVDLSWEDARTTMENIGFRILEEKRNMYATYTDDNRSLMSTSFRCIFFVARKSSSMLYDTRKTRHQPVINL
jgi:hypothetical protein